MQPASRGELGDRSIHAQRLLHEWPRDQHWHKDDNGPYNSRKQRHHQAVQIEMLYYPQAVREDMGPTATVPYSQ